MVAADSAGSSGNLDLSGDPVGCIRSVELFTNSYTTGGWSSTTYTWISGMSVTDSTGAVTSFGTTAASAGSVNFGDNGCLVSIKPVQDGYGDVQSVVMYSKAATTLFTTASTVSASSSGGSGKRSNNSGGGGFTMPEKEVIIGAAAVLGLIVITGVYCALRTKKPDESGQVADVS